MVQALTCLEMIGGLSPSGWTALKEEEPLGPVADCLAGCTAGKGGSRGRQGGGWDGADRWQLARWEGSGDECFAPALRFLSFFFSRGVVDTDLYAAKHSLAGMVRTRADVTRGWRLRGLGLCRGRYPCWRQSFVGKGRGRWRRSRVSLSPSWLRRMPR